MPFKGMGQLVKLGKAMIVTDKSTCGLPNMLFWVQIGGSRWQIDNFEPWMVLQDLLNRLPPMPRRPIPEKQDRLSRIGRQ